MKDWILLAAKKAVGMGITTVHDAWQDKTIIEAIKELIIEGVTCLLLVMPTIPHIIFSFYNF